MPVFILPTHNNSNRKEDGCKLSQFLFQKEQESVNISMIGRTFAKVQDSVRILGENPITQL